MRIYFQISGKSLYPEVIFNKPETKALAGKLLIIGGNSGSIVAPSLAYQLATKYGAGEIKVLMPNATKKLFGGAVPPDIHFAPSSPSGSFDHTLIETLHAYADWADAMLLAGDFSKNSQTTLALHDVERTFAGIHSVTSEIAELYLDTPELILDREHTVITLSFAQLQKITAASGFKDAITSTLPSQKVYELLGAFSALHAAHLIVIFRDSVIVASAGDIVVTAPLTNISSLAISTSATVWVMQQPHDPLKALACAVSQL